jgi:hypothetical protein
MPRLPQLPRLSRLIRHPRFRRQIRHPLLPALGAALLCQAVLVSLLRPSQSSASAPPPAGAQAQAADDTPELLRLSRTLLQSAATPNPQLSQLLALPLPPPPELTQQQPAARPPAPAAACPPGPKQAAKAPGPAPASSAAKPPPPPPAASGPPAPGELPSQPGQALELAKAVAGGKQALATEGASPTQVALQRRQWWLTAQEAGQLQRAWDQAEQQGAGVEAPGDWAPLPAGAQLRRVERQSLGPLAGGDFRGRSLVSREQITLLWGSGPQLWLLRLPLAG